MSWASKSHPIWTAASLITILIFASPNSSFLVLAYIDSWTKRCSKGVSAWASWVTLGISWARACGSPHPKWAVPSRTKQRAPVSSAKNIPTGSGSWLLREFDFCDVCFYIAFHLSTLLSSVLQLRDFFVPLFLVASVCFFGPDWFVGSLSQDKSRSSSSKQLNFFSAVISRVFRWS